MRFCSIFGAVKLWYWGSTKPSGLLYLGNFNAVCGFLILLCALFICISVPFCGVRIPLTPSISTQNVLNLVNSIETFCCAHSWNSFQHEKRNFVSPSDHIHVIVMFYLFHKHQWDTKPFHFSSFFLWKAWFFYVVEATVIFLQVKITCNFHVWRYHVFAGKLNWYFIGVYIINYMYYSKNMKTTFLKRKKRWGKNSNSTSPWKKEAYDKLKLFWFAPSPYPRKGLVQTIPGLWAQKAGLVPVFVLGEERGGGVNSGTACCRFIASYIRLYNYRGHAHPLGVGQVNCSYIQWGICHQRSAQTLVDHCKLFNGSLMSHELCDLMHLLYFVLADLS